MDWIKKQAMLYRNLASTNRYQAIVHLEDKEDETFWDYQLQNVKPGRSTYIIAKTIREQIHEDANNALGSSPI